MVVQETDDSLSPLDWVAGIDENGLGPCLGPLVVTGVSARLDPRPYPTHASWKQFASVRLGDSKRLVGFGHSFLGEAWARVLTQPHHPPLHTPDQVLHTLLLDPPAVLRARCPEVHEPLCWGVQGEQFRAPPPLMEAVRGDLAELAHAGVQVAHIKVAVVCTERLNAAQQQGLSRLQVDLHTMERVALALQEESQADMKIACGKVGGMNRYLPHFGPLATRTCTALEEGRARSTYRVAGVGTLSFVRNAEQEHVLVALASLIGKWVRDLLMERIVRGYQQEDPSLPNVSGYHDPRTRQFVTATALLRQARGIPDACFLRK